MDERVIRDKGFEATAGRASAATTAVAVVVGDAAEELLTTLSVAGAGVAFLLA